MVLILIFLILSKGVITVRFFITACLLCFNLCASQKISLTNQELHQGICDYCDGIKPNFKGLSVLQNDLCNKFIIDGFVEFLLIVNNSTNKLDAKKFLASYSNAYNNTCNMTFIIAPTPPHCSFSNVCHNCSYGLLNYEGIKIVRSTLYKLTPLEEIIRIIDKRRSRL